MTSKERIQIVLQHLTPDRIARDLRVSEFVRFFNTSEYDSLRRRYPPDIEHITDRNRAHKSREAAIRKGGHYRDIWGSTWYVAEPGYSGTIVQPVLAEWSDLSHFRLPWSTIRHRDIFSIRRQCSASKAFTLTEPAAAPFETLVALRGMENVFLDLVSRPRQFDTLLERIHEFFLRNIMNWCQTPVDAILLMDDWGSNQDLFIQPQLWRELFQPLYREYSNLIHSAGKTVFFHSDGNIQKIFPDLVKIGIDAVNSQLYLMDADLLYEEFGSQIVFWGDFIAPNVLANDPPQIVQSELQKVLHHLEKASASFILRCEWNKDQPVGNIASLFSTDSL